MAENVDDTREVRTSTSEENKVTGIEEKLTTCSAIGNPEEIVNPDELLMTKKSGEFMAVEMQIKVQAIPPVASKEVDACDKHCANGHPCMGKRGEDCPPCAVKVLLVSKNCGHRMILPCCVGVQERFKERCYRMGNSPWRCNCGQKIQLPCYVGGKPLTWEEAMMFCPKCSEDKDIATVIAYTAKYGHGK